MGRRIISARLCRELASTIGGGSSTIGGFCTVFNVRTFNATLLGRPVKDPLVNIFTFEPSSLPNCTLNLGSVTVRSGEITRFVNALNRQGIQVSSISDTLVFIKPSLSNVYFQSVSPAKAFARKVRNALNLLNDIGPFPASNPTRFFTNTCTQFANILGAFSATPFSNVCQAYTVSGSPVSISGQKSNSFLARTGIFVFESLQKGVAVNWGNISLTQKQVTPFLAAIRQQGGLINASLSKRWLFQRPQLVNFEYISRSNPLVFARKTKNSLQAIGK